MIHSLMARHYYQRVSYKLLRTSDVLGPFSGCCCLSRPPSNGTYANHAGGSNRISLLTSRPLT